MMGLAEAVAVVDVVTFLAGLAQLTGPAVGEQAGVTGTLAEASMLEG